MTNKPTLKDYSDSPAMHKLSPPSRERVRELKERIEPHEAQFLNLVTSIDTVGGMIHIDDVEIREDAPHATKQKLQTALQGIKRTAGRGLY